MTITAKPILFSAPMIKAILREIENHGTGKTQTRRIIKPQPYADDHNNCIWNGINFGQGPDGTPHFDHLASPFPSSKTKKVNCPYGKPGDLLYVRETYAEVGTCDPGWLLYRASGYKNECRRHGFDQCPDESEMKWTPSIHMPRWASRITLEVTDVRVQRLKDISILDAISEGVTRDDSASCYAKIMGLDWSLGNGRTGCPRKAFHCLWTSINGTESWEANPWVWAVSFTPHLINVDRFIEERAAA